MAWQILISGGVCVMTKEDTITFDFEDDGRPVPAHRHPNGGGWVADTAYAADTAYVGPNARVYGTARVYGAAQVYDSARLYGTAQVFGLAQVCGVECRY
jgi:hypothetical protein